MEETEREVREKGVGEEEGGEGWRREEEGEGNGRGRKAREAKKEGAWRRRRRRVPLRWMCYADEMQESVRSRRWVAALFWR